MANVSHDKSTVKAIIKGGITEWQNTDRKIVAAETRKIYSIKGNMTGKRYFVSMKKMWQKSYQDYTLSSQTIKERLTQHKVFFLIHFDFETTEYFNKENYPELFFVSMIRITTRGNFRKEDFESSFFTSMGLMCLTRHSLERIVKRNKCEHLKEVTKILTPLSTAAVIYAISFHDKANEEKSIKRALVSKHGYAIFGWEKEHDIPVVVTWLPIHWWDERQHTKLDRLIIVLKESGSEWVMINEEQFNKPLWIDPRSIPQENFMFFTWEKFWNVPPPKLLAHKQMLPG